MLAAGAALAATILLPATLEAGESATAQEIVAQVRTNNRADLVTLRLSPPRARLSELRIRSGHIPILLLAVEIEFADGTVARHLTQESLAPGAQSRPVTVDPRRAVARILVSKKPGLRDGETLLQLLAR